MRNPGPGDYDTQNKDNLNMKNGAKFGMGTSKRSNTVNRSHSNLPAPGSYDISLVDKLSNPKFGFGTSKRDGAGRNTSKL